MSKSIQFVTLFITTYLLMQLGYTGYLWLYEPEVDPLTLFTAKLLIPMFDNATLIAIPGAAKVQFQINGKAIVNVKEACNGLSVLIALLAFLLAYRGSLKRYVLFLPISLIVIFVGNLMRLVALIVIKVDYPGYFVIFHEYVFPAVLYLFAFGIMVWWVRGEIEA